MKFEVLSSTHTDKNGVEYLKGQIVTSIKQLDKFFLNKFRRRKDLESLPASETERLNRIRQRQALAEQERIREREAAKDNKAVAEDIDEVVKPTATPPENMDQDEPDDPESEAQVTDDDDEPDTMDKGPAPHKPVRSSLGTDVTVGHPVAQEGDFLVFQDRKKRFHLASPEDPGTALNPLPMKSAGDVTRLVRKIAKGK